MSDSEDKTLSAQQNLDLLTKFRGRKLKRKFIHLQRSKRNFHMEKLLKTKQ